MQQDFDDFKQLMIETHPGLFRYQTEEQYSKSVSYIESKISQALPFYEFYKLLAGLSAQIRCAHTAVFPTRDVMKLMRESCTPFPFFIYPINDKLYVLFNGTSGQEIKPGFELVSINGRPSDEISETIKMHYGMDGNPASVPRRYLQGGYFSLYHYLFVEQASEYEIEFRDLSRKPVRISVPGQTYRDIDRNYFSNPLNKEMLTFYNKKLRNWDFKLVEEVPSTAQIHFTGFGGKGMDTEEDAQLAMQKFMNKAIKKMNQKNITNLIVELRGNTGGWDIQGKELFSYLMKSSEPALYYKDQFAATTDSRYLEYSDVSAEDLERARSFLIPQENGSYKLDPEGNATLLPQEPKENRFSGNVYIMVDEQCSSSCAEFVAVAKSNNIGVLVGSESGGAYEGGNGGSFINYTLPNSGIYITSPLVKYEMAVEPVEEVGLGTIPDHSVGFTVEDILTGRDAQKEFVYDLIRKDTNTSKLME